jgi:signal transduction histidine kinase
VVAVRLQVISARVKQAIFVGYTIFFLLPILNLLIFSNKIPIELYNYNFALVAAATVTGFMLMVIYIQTHQFKENAQLTQIHLAQEKHQRTIDQRIHQEQTSLFASISQDYKNSLAAAGQELSNISEIAQRLTSAAEKPQGLQLGRAKMELVGELSSVALTAPELKLLEAFAVNQGKVLEYDALGLILGKAYSHKDWKSLAVIITRLRKKMLAAGADARCITSVRGLGYQCTVELVIS